ncbi:MAG: FAD:protein FMN transferase [Opitutaceae bacterium]|nr:FAD:protein FMN transferase [Opitutaceae bacterium]
MKRLLSLFAASLGVVASGATDVVTLTGRAMGTAWTVKFQAPAHGLDPEGLRARIAARLEALEQQLSTWRPSSDLSRFNTTAHTAWFSAPPELIAVAAASLRVAALTGGAFDPTVAPLVRLWGFGAEGSIESVPSPEAVAFAQARVDWRTLEVEASPPALRRTRPGITVDFSSTAKGFAADAVSALLATEDLPRHLVQIGGDVRTGAAPDGRSGWPVAIEQPLDEGRGIACVVPLAGLAVSTSGDYRNFFRAGAQRHGHIIDPRTGRPVQGDLASVTVVHPSAAVSSSLATGLFVLGLEAGRRLAEREGLACLFLVRDGGGFTSLPTAEFEKLRPSSPPVAPRAGAPRRP